MAEFISHHSHWRAFCIALASSTDNVLVGFSLGMGRDRFTWWIIVVGIAVVNAGGGWLATIMGATAADMLYFDPNALAGLAFLVLSFNEMCTTMTVKDKRTAPSKERAASTSSRAEDKQQRHSASQSFFKMTQLAVPMTLNNLAGGVATGVAGIPASLAALYVLIVSLVGMTAGLAAAAVYQQNQQQRPTTPTGRHFIHWSAALYAVLGVQCCIGAWRGT